MDQDIKVAREEFHKQGAETQAIGAEVREARKAGKPTGEIEAKLAKAIADFKVKSQELAQAEALANVGEQLEEFAKSDRSTLRQMGIEPAKLSKELHAEAFGAFLRGGEQAAREVLMERKAPRETFGLLGTKDDMGGIIAPADFKSEIIKAEAGMSAIRSAGARVVPTDKSEVVWPKIKRNTSKPDMYTSGFAGKFVGHGEKAMSDTATVTTQSPSLWSELRIPVHAWQPDAIEISYQQIEDGVFPIESVLAELIAETKALDEDYECTLGDGVKGPRGIMFEVTAGNIAHVASGHATLITYKGVVDVFTAVPAQYRGDSAYMMNSVTFGKIIQLETSTGAFPLFPPNSLPGTILGKRIVFNEWMSDVGAGAFPVIFGQWRSYVIPERSDLRIKRLLERFAPNVGILPIARMGGLCTRPYAFKALEIAAS